MIDFMKYVMKNLVHCRNKRNFFKTRKREKFVRWSMYNVSPGARIDCRNVNQSFIKF